MGCQTGMNATRHDVDLNLTCNFHSQLGNNEECSDFLGAVVSATNSAPKYLSQRQTNDAIDSIAHGSCCNRRVSKAMLAAVLSDGTMPSFSCTKLEEAMFLEDTTQFILSLDNNKEKELISDMCRLNCRGNTDESMAYHHRHAAVDEATTNDLSYAPGILSINELIGVTADILKKDGKVQGQDFEVPSESW
eukprot:5858199-Ditylum_brightwellii.AAC.1